MSDAQKIKMEMSAYGKTKTEQERSTRRLLDSTDCPFASVFSSTGGPSTESSVTCNFAVNDILPGWWPDCNSQYPGQVSHCPLLPRLYLCFKNAQDGSESKSITDKFLALRKIQVNKMMFIQRVDGCVGWWELK